MLYKHKWRAEHCIRAMVQDFAFDERYVHSIFHLMGNLVPCAQSTNRHLYTVTLSRAAIIAKITVSNKVNNTFNVKERKEVTH